MRDLNTSTQVVSIEDNRDHSVNINSHNTTNITSIISGLDIDWRPWQATVVMFLIAIVLCIFPQLLMIPVMIVVAGIGLLEQVAALIDGISVPIAIAAWLLSAGIGLLGIACLRSIYAEDQRAGGVLSLAGVVGLVITSFFLFTEVNPRQGVTLAQPVQADGISEAELDFRWKHQTRYIAMVRLKIKFPQLGDIDNVICGDGWPGVYDDTNLQIVMEHGIPVPVNHKYSCLDFEKMPDFLRIPGTPPEKIPAGIYLKYGERHGFDLVQSSEVEGGWYQALWWLAEEEWTQELVDMDYDLTTWQVPGY